jgi:hypothetical protein
VARRKLSPKDWASLNDRARIGVRYPPGGGPAELRMFGAKEPRRRRKKPDELAGEPTRVRPRVGKGTRASRCYPSKIANVEAYIPTSARRARSSRAAGASPRGRRMTIGWPYLRGIWVLVSRYTTAQEGASIVNVKVYNPRGKAARIAERMRRDASRYFG